MKICSFVPILLLAIVLMPQSAEAQSVAEKKVMAAQLFDDAQASAAKSDFTQACARYAESQRLDPQLGTLLYLGDCYDKIGKTASAWATFKDAVEIAARRRDERETPARARLAELEPRLCKLTIQIASDETPNLEIRRNGEVVSQAMIGSPMPLDPGEHTVLAKADGFEDWSKTVSVLAGTSNLTVVVPQLKRRPVKLQGTTSPQPAPSPTAAVLQPRLASTVDSVPPDAGATKRMLGYFVGSAGLVGIGIGAIFGLAERSRLSDRDNANACSATTIGCTFEQKGRIEQLSSQAKTDATMANVGLFGGGMALVGGIILVATGWSTAAHPTTIVELQPWVGNKFAGIGAGGVW